MTDLRLINGDLVIGQDGFPAEVSGIDLLAQQFRIASIIPKTKFIYDRALGAFLNPPDCSDSNRVEKANVLINEAMIDCAGEIRVNSVEAENGKVVIRAELYDNYYATEREVEIDG